MSSVEEGTQQKPKSTSEEETLIDGIQYIFKYIYMKLLKLNKQPNDKERKRKNYLKVSI
jgi:hypothetical protein